MMNGFLKARHYLIVRKEGKQYRVEKAKGGMNIFCNSFFNIFFVELIISNYDMLAK